MKEDDIFHPGVSEEQIRRAEEMLGNLSLEMFVEKRSSSNKFKPGILMLPGYDAAVIKVLVSAAFEERMNERALLSKKVIPKSEYAELVIRQGVQKIRLKGRVEASHPGQRKDDQKHERPLNVTLFYEQAQ